MLYFEVGQAVSLKYRRCLKTLQKSSLGILSEKQVPICVDEKNSWYKKTLVQVLLS